LEGPSRAVPRVGVPHAQSAEPIVSELVTKGVIVAGDLNEPVLRVVGEGVEIQARGISVRIVTGTTRQLILHIDGECRRRIIVRADVQVLTRVIFIPLGIGGVGSLQKDSQTRSATARWDRKYN
jgi:hypothetical protein